MNQSDIFKNKKVTVMGLGLHGGGLAVVKWLYRQGAKILITDLREKEILLPSIKKLPKKNISYVLGKHREKDFNKVDLVIKNPGVPRNSKYLALAKKNHIPVETDMSIFFKMCKSPVIGVTGTKGKSTTTSLIYQLLKNAKQHPLLGGNIRISPLTFLNKIKPGTPIVLELSSWQLEDMEHQRHSPHLAVITNILPDHLNRYKNIGDYAKSKQLIFKFQNKNDFGVLNYDNPLTREMGKTIPGKRFWFSTKFIKEENSCFIKNQSIFFRINGIEEKICTTKDVKIIGHHNLGNILAAVAVAKILLIPNYIIKATIYKFEGIADRLELIRKYQGRLFYNDTTATAPEAAMAALKCFANQRIILLAGGHDKDLKYAGFAKYMKKYSKEVILFKGSATDKIIKELIKVHYQKYMIVDTMKKAVMRAWQASRAGSVVLLSPGAASFGIFLNEFDRGHQFKKIVKNLR